jgi:TRAP transporter TAXI family solute receptor
MRRIFNHWGWLVPVLSLTAASCSRNGGNAIFATLGTGGVTGVYYPTGGAIAKLVNRAQDTYGVRLSVESTGGSVYNLNAVASGQLQFGMAQADLHYQAWNGQGDWDGAPLTNLRSVMALHPEIITLVAADDAGIRSIADLAGKHINLGNPGSGNRANAEDVLRAAGLDPATDVRGESLPAPEAPRMIQDDRIDAFFYTVGHPNGAISESTSGRRPVRFVPIELADTFFAERPYYTAVSIPVDLYPQAANDAPVPSIGVATTLVTAEEVGEDAVYALVNEVLDQFDAFIRTHPALQNLEPSSLTQGLTAPLHPGAERAYREHGLMP